MTELKRCSRCEKEQSIANFYKNKASKDGLHPICKKCKAIYNKQYGQAHKEKIAKCKKQYIQDHKKEIAQYKKRYHQTHKEKMAKRNKQYNQTVKVQEEKGNIKGGF